MLKFDMGCFLDRPKLLSEYRQNLKGSALFCVDLTWNDPVAKGLMEWLERPRPRRSAGTQALLLRLTERPFPEPVPDGKCPDCAALSL